MYSIGIVGRTNAGKSSLINTLTMQKIAAVSKTVNTTRKPIRGFMEWKKSKLLLFDSPGVCRVKTTLDKVLVRNLHTVINNSNIIWLMVEIDDVWKQDLVFLTKLLKASNKPLLLLINKMDRKTIQDVANYIRKVQDQKIFTAILPVSAKKNLNLAKLLDLTMEIAKKTPSLNQQKVLKPALNTEKQVREIGNEVIREQIIFQTKEEIPHQIATRMLEIKIKPTKVFITCQIVVANVNQKKIILGRNGRKIKLIRMDSSRILHKLFKRYINLRLEIKVIKNWFQNKQVIKELNLIEEDDE